MTVELYDAAKRYSAPAGAHLVYGGGALMSDTKLVGVFVDELSGSQYALKSAIDAFLAYFAGSSVEAELKEYDESGNVLETGKYLGAFDVSLGSAAPPPPPPPPPPPGGNCEPELEALISCLGYVKPKASPVSEHLAKAAHKHREVNVGHATTAKITDQDIQNLLETNMSALPQPDANTLYVLMFPTGVTISVGSDTSCVTFCGYHSSFVDGSGRTIRYAVQPFPDCSGCQGGLSNTDVLTSILTHEIAESETDAAADGSGWYDQANGEIGDICAWQFKQVDGHTVQLLWSNTQNNCI